MSKTTLEKRKEVRKKSALKYRKSPRGLLIRSYYRQCKNSKKRGHDQPAYTSLEFVNRFVNDPVYIRLYREWVNSGENVDLRPSFDRIDNAKGYSFSNIQLTTWRQNNINGNVSKQVPVKVFKDHYLVKICKSLIEAAEFAGHTPGCVSGIKDTGKSTGTGYSFASVDKSELDYYSKIV